MSTLAPDKQGTNEDPKAWFSKGRFGAFIHWGIYSHSGKEASWPLSHGTLNYADYDRYQSVFDGDLYDPDEWGRQMKEAGITYAYLATKHHDGFSLWDTAYSDYKVTNSPAGRDLVGPYVEAMRRHGIKVGLYYSLIDWHHEHFPIDSLHPLRNLPDDPTYRTPAKPKRDVAALNSNRDMKIYAEFMRNQLTELFTNYGQIDALWYDFSYAKRPSVEGWVGKGHLDWESEKIYELSRRLQPNMLINNRLALPKETGMLADFETPEQFVPQTARLIDGKMPVWECCVVSGEQWAYYPGARDWQESAEPAQLIKILVHIVSLGGNLLLGVGPTARGRFGDRSKLELEAYAKWMDLHSRSIHGCGPSQYQAPQDCRLTQNGNRIYVHIFSWPFRHIHLSGLAGKVHHAQFLHDGSEVKIAHEHRQDHYVDFSLYAEPNLLTLEVPVRKPNIEVPVIELFLKD